MKQIIFVFIILLIGCASPQKRINRITRKHPEVLQSQIKIVHDTFLIRKDSLIKQLQVVRDLSKYDSLLDEYAFVSNKLGGVEFQLEKEKQKKKIKEEIIKTVFPDTTFKMALQQAFVFNDSLFYVTGSIFITLSPKDGVRLNYNRDSIIIPYVKSETNQNIDAKIGKPFYRIWWFWLFLLSLGWIFRKQIGGIVYLLVKRMPI